MLTGEMGYLVQVRRFKGLWRERYLAWDTKVPGRKQFGRKMRVTERSEGSNWSGEQAVLTALALNPVSALDLTLIGGPVTLGSGLTVKEE